MRQLRFKSDPREVAGRRWRDDRRAILEFNRSLSLIVDPDALTASVAARIKELFGADRILLLRPVSDGGVFHVAFSTGYDASERKGAHLRQDDRLVKWLQTNEAVLSVGRDAGVLGYLGADENALLARLKVGVCAPLLALNRLTGIMLLSSTQPGWRLGEEDLSLLQMLTSLASIAFEQAYLYQQQRDRLRKLYRTERLATAGELAASVAHEIRNPLTSIRSTVQYLLTGFAEGSPSRELTEALIGEVDRIDHAVEGLLHLTRRTEFKFERLALEQLLEESLRLVWTKARGQSVAVTYGPPPSSVQVLGDAVHLKQIFLNLLLNALQAMPDGGTLEVRVDAQTLPVGVGKEKAWARVLIADTGCGIPAQNLEKIFDPFFTSKPGGTGLGLTISYNIAQQHGGELEIYSDGARGATAELRLPLVR